ncbi:MAG: hypothetical protein ACPLOC_08965 [Candidatus Bathyarchaeales archaeon]
MRKQSWFIIAAVAAGLVVAVAFFLNQELVVKHMYPQDALHRDANLAVRGIVTSVEQNHATSGLVATNYHIWRFFVRLNITEVLWTSEEYLNSSVGGCVVFGSNSICVGYDYLDELELAAGQKIECKGFYLGVTDTAYSFVLTVSPSINGSYLKLIG